MEYRILTGTGIKVSRIALGSSTFGDQLDEKASFEIMKAGVDAGMNMIDTGDVYCGGESERIIGKFVQGMRDKILIGTKVFLPTGQGVNDGRCSRYHIINAVDASLKRLKTSYIDIYFIHHPDRITPMDEILEAMDNLVRSGKVRYTGISNHSAWESCDMVWTAKQNRLIAPVVAQNVFNLITRGLEDEMAHFLQKFKMGLMIYNPNAGGLLTGKHTRDHLAENTRFASKMYQERYCTDRNFDAIDELTLIASEAGMPLIELSIRWCLTHSFIDSVLMGYSKTSQLEQNIKIAEKGPLSEDIMDECSKVWNKLKGSLFGYFIPPTGAVGVNYTGTLK